MTTNGSYLDLDLLSKETGYPIHSKILNNAIQKLNDKGFLKSELIEKNGSKSIHIKISSEKKDFVKKILQDKNDELKFIPTIDIDENFDEFQKSDKYQYNINKTKLESLNGSGIINHHKSSWKPDKRPN